MTETGLPALTQGGKGAGFNLTAALGQQPALTNAVTPAAANMLPIAQQGAVQQTVAAPTGLPQDGSTSAITAAHQAVFDVVHPNAGVDGWFQLVP
jgi:hypothetical protein